MAEQSFKDYCSRMRSDGEWGGNLELQVIACLYNVRIIIHQDSGAPALCIQPERKTVSEIHILLQEEHYDSVRNNDDCKWISEDDTQRRKLGASFG